VTARARTPAPTAAAPAPAAPAPLPAALRLQRAAGNHAVGALVRAKLELGGTHDPEEQEADRAAEAVTAAKTCACGTAGAGTCETCRGSGAVRRSAAGAGAAGAGAAPPAVHAALAGPGVPLSAALRADMGPRFGHDFSGVRVHTDAAAADSARTIGARAYAAGADVVFAAGQFAPDTADGRRLLAHELAHVVQQSGAAPAVRRDPGDGGVPPAPTDDRDAGAPPPPASPGSARPDPARAGYPSVTLTAGPDTAPDEIRALVVANGKDAPGRFIEWLRDQVARVTAAQDVVAGVVESADREMLADLRDRALPVYVAAGTQVAAEVLAFVADFEAAAVTNAYAIVRANEEQAKAEMKRYGITTTLIEDVQGGSGEGVGGSTVSVEYGMPADSTAGKELQTAAQLLLTRRREIDRMTRDRDMHLTAMGYTVGDVRSRHVTEYESLAPRVEEARQGYLRVRAGLCSRNPALAAFSVLDAGTGDLETLAAGGDGRGAATLVGRRVSEQMTKIARVRAGLRSKADVNTWQLPKVVDVTRLSRGVAAGSWQARVVDDTVAAEAPGVLGEIALAVLNVAALLAAGPTGGLSLAFAAGVNAAVAAGHIEDYVREAAVSGTAFDKAQALSQDEPSFVWLAVEIIGVGLDAHGAVSAMKALKGPVRAVQAARDAAAVEEASKVLDDAARAELRNAEAAGRVVAAAKRAGAGGDEALRLAGLTEREVGELAKAGRLAAEHVVAKSADGLLTLSRSGFLYLCASPCRMLAERYAVVVARHPEYAAKIAHVEREVGAAAAAVTRAEAEGLAEVAALRSRAQALLHDAEALDGELRALERQLADEGGLVAEGAADAATAADRLQAVTSPKVLEDLRAQRPKLDSPPHGVPTPADQQMWREYVQYYDERLLRLEQDLANPARVPRNPPRTFESYRAWCLGDPKACGFLANTRRGTLFQAAQDAALADEFGRQSVHSNVGVSQSLANEVHGDIKFVDHFVRRPEGSFAGMSSKSRDFAGVLARNGDDVTRALPEVLGQVRADVRELFEKYGGWQTVRRQELGLVEPVKVTELILNLDGSLIPKELREQVVAAARAEGNAAAREAATVYRNANLTFDIRISP